MIAKEYRIEMVNISDINIVNPRSREAKKYAEIVKSIKSIGLKTPIVVAERRNEANEISYDLVCGEGRLNAYKTGGEAMIPARIIRASTEDVLLMSLVENFARKQPTNKTALIKELERLSSEGYSQNEIAKKVGLSPNYICQLMKLISRKEPLLVQAVLQGKMKISIALIIADCGEDEELQKYISEAYSNKEIKGGDLRYIRNLIRNRKEGVLKRKGIYGKEKGEAFISVCKKEMEAGFAFLRKAEICERNLAYIKGAFKKILADECFLNLMIAQGISSIPSELSMEIENGE